LTENVTEVYYHITHLPKPSTVNTRCVSRSRRIQNIKKCSYWMFRRNDL